MYTNIYKSGSHLDSHLEFQKLPKIREWYPPDIYHICLKGLKSTEKKLLQPLQCMLSQKWALAADYKKHFQPQNIVKHE